MPHNYEGRAYIFNYVTQFTTSIALRRPLEYFLLMKHDSFIKAFNFSEIFCKINN